MCKSNDSAGAKDALASIGHAPHHGRWLFLLLRTRATPPSRLNRRVVWYNAGWVADVFSPCIGGLHRYLPSRRDAGSSYFRSLWSTRIQTLGRLLAGIKAKPYQLGVASCPSAALQTPSARLPRLPTRGAPGAPGPNPTCRRPPFRVPVGVDHGQVRR